jgi:uncharacterized protein (DUF2147 family)
MRIILAAFVTIIATAVPTIAQTTSPLSGVWRRQDGGATVRIAPCGNGPELCAVVVAEKLELNEASRLGKVTVKDIKPSGPRRWTGVFVDQGSSMNARIQQLSSDVTSFRVCIFPFVCETQKFSRIGR